MPVKWIGYLISSDDIGTVTIQNTLNESVSSSSPQELIALLYKAYKVGREREIKYFFDVDDSMSQVFRLLNIQQLKGILATKNGGSYNLFGYEVSYSRERNFIIRGETYFEGRQYWSCIYQLKQYVKDEEPKDIDGLRILGDKVRKAFENIGITTPVTLNSAISVWESAMKTTELTMIPSINNIPNLTPDVLELAEKCSRHQGYVTSLKVGNFEKDLTYSFDLSSAYGYWLSRTRNFKNVEITKYSKDYPYKDLILKGDVTGYFDCNITIFHETKLHPFAYRTEQNDLIYPTGTYDTSLMLEEMLALTRSKVGKINRILSGHYVRFLDRGVPLLNIVNKLFKQRSLGEIEDGICKSIIVQMVGKSLMTNKTTGEASLHYNPLLVSWVYSMCRLQDFNFILKNNLSEHTIAIATDEIISTQPAMVTKIETGKKTMGSWRQKEKSNMLILSPGWIIGAGKKPHSVDYDTVIEAIHNDPHNNQYKFAAKRRVTLFEAVEILHDPSQVGKITDHYETIDLIEIRASQDRMFKKFPATGKQILSKIYDSTPISI